MFRILASWDNEEYGLVGSTEWVEDNADWLSKNCVAYINVDESTNGGRFLGALGSPLLDAVIRASAVAVPSPIFEGKTVYDDWLADLQRADSSLEEPSLALLGTGSDYTAFFHHLGIPAVDMIFNRQGQGVYPYHSNYDSFYWLEHFGDVGFKKHKAMAQLWGLVVLKLAGAPTLPFVAADYSTTLSRHFATLCAANRGLERQEFDKALAKFAANAARFDERAKNAHVLGEAEVTAVNQRLIALERGFLLEKGSGLEGRPWYRHEVSPLESEGW